MLNVKDKKKCIKCKHCGDVIESTDLHNFVTCSCGCCSVDGGFDYIRGWFKHSQEKDCIDLINTIEVD